MDDLHRWARRAAAAAGAVAALCVAASVLADGTAGYQVVRGWPQLPPGKSFGAVSGVGVDSRGNVFVFHRNDRVQPESGALSTDLIPTPTVTLLDGRSGAILKEWGENLFAMPHGLCVDDEDNVWLTDIALHQVYKFSHDGQLLWTLGERGVPGSDSEHFNEPTDVAIGPDGSVFVTDGYRNTRVVKLSSKARFMFQWGTPGAGPAQFDVPHGIAVDRAGRVYVADRGNRRVQIFDENGGYIGEWNSDRIGRPFSVAVTASGKAFVADGGDASLAPRSGVAVLRTDGSLIGRFGRYGHGEGEFAAAHDLAVGRDGAVYVGEIDGARVQKFVPR